MSFNYILHYIQWLFLFDWCEIMLSDWYRKTKQSFHVLSPKETFLRRIVSQAVYECQWSAVNATSRLKSSTYSGASSHSTTNYLEQWFSNLSYKHPCPAHFVCVPYQAHLIQLISSLVETARPELGVSTRDTYKMCREGVLVGQVWKPLI